ncbi:MAG: ATP-dependent sacrificial sulfur transferase LarE [Chitinivibrionia bacterium]|nr:ATP-dependent sacrificial sulfur transferase LarE [Chitinivibrionia bacterium]
MRSNLTPPPDAQAAYEHLENILKRYGSMVVAYSGGVDSALLAYCASRALGESALAVIGVSPSLSQRERESALEFLERYSIPYQCIDTGELADPEYARNHPDRCYHCKSELFSKLQSVASSRGLRYVAYGANADDAAEYRPGSAAAMERGVAAPLAEAGMGKEAIRSLARGLSLELWDKPASPCLASRIPYYSPVDAGKLEQVERAENALKDLGFGVCRVRHHGAAATIEIPRSEFARLFDGDTARRVAEAVKSAGFSFAALDLDGFKSGKLNETISSQSDIDPARSD